MKPARVLGAALVLALSCTVVLWSSAMPVQSQATDPGAASVGGVPMCDGQNGRPAHDPTRWHPLVEVNADGSVLCTYGHEHGMDPRQFDGQFGPLSVPGGQQISYPWATETSTGVPENGPDYKHRSYKWMGFVRGCVSSQPQVTALRWEAHNDGSIGATARFHSYWFEAFVTDCAAGDVGYISMGGHMDFAHLLASTRLVPLPGDPPDACVLSGDGRQEGALGQAEQANSVWYGASGRGESAPGCDDAYGARPHVAVLMNLGTDSWGPVDPNDPGAFHFYPDREAHHGTVTASDTFNVTASPEFATDAAGKVNFSGFVDRHGQVVPSGCALSPDCIPLTIRNLKAWPTVYKMDDAGVGYNGDVSGPNGQPGHYVQTPSLNR